MIRVQKYGGTSVGTIDKIRAVAKRVVEDVRKNGPEVAVVASAMSGETNRLVDLMQQVNPDPSGANYDLAVSAGEQVAIALLSEAIRMEGIEARPLLAFQLGIKTSSDHALAKIESIDTAQIFRAWKDGCIPVIAGFQGIAGDNSITTLGRGGGDTSAVAVAAALKASHCEINTDVSGVMSADPRLCKDAKLIPEMDFSVAFEMAALGSKVLHSRSVELAAKYNIPLIVRDSFEKNPRIQTEVRMFSESEALESPVVSGVSLEKNVIRVSLQGLPRSASSLSKVFSLLAESHVNVDIIVRSVGESRYNAPEGGEGFLGFTVSQSEEMRLLDALKSLKSLPGFESVRTETGLGLAKVSVVGLGMKSHHGVASRLFQKLDEAGVDVIMVSTSEIKISCVTKMEDAEKAVQIAHQEFIEG